jgi:2-dehydro-3-deoxygluconokinase
MATDFICFGELLLRLGAPGRELLLQSPRLDVHVGGAEANVGIALAQFGHAVELVSVLPEHALAQAALGEVRRHGVGTGAVLRGEGRLGLYFLATGSGLRPSEVIYDRAGSAFARTPATAFDWDALLPGAWGLHVSGVTPALGQASADAALAAMTAARRHGLFVSFDGNFRPKLWQAWDGDAPGILAALMAQADVLFADHRDIGTALDWTPPDGSPDERIAAAAERAFAAFPNLGRMACTRRSQRSVDDHALAASLHARDGQFHRAEPLELSPIVDRIGAGDAFAAGVLHGLRRGQDDADALRFGLAAAALKHSVPGDFNRVGIEAVQAVVDGGRLDVRR